MLYIAFNTKYLSEQRLSRRVAREVKDEVLVALRVSRVELTQRHVAMSDVDDAHCFHFELHILAIDDAVEQLERRQTCDGSNTSSFVATLDGKCVTS